jgi:endo-beta-N-acetylglucosaminidase D
VTIPPPSWIDIAHKHNVKMLGTLIFEQWGDRNSIGKEAKVMLDGKIVASLDLSESAKNINNLHYAEQLVRICKHYGFEGYLMNFEVKIENT